MLFPELADMTEGRTLLVRLAGSVQTPTVGTEVQFIDRDELSVMRFPGSGQTVEVEGDDPRTRRDLSDLISAQRPALAWIDQILPERQNTPRRLCVALRFFSGQQISEHPLRIHVDRLFLEDLARKEQDSFDLEKAARWLTAEFVLPARSPSGLPRMVMRPGRTEESAFLLIGPRWSLGIRRQTGGGWMADSLVRPRQVREEARWLFEARVEFGEFPAGTEGEIVAALDALRRSDKGYLSLWKGYQELEWKSIAERAKEFGHLRYVETRRRADGTWEFTLETSTSEAQMAYARGENDGFVAAQSLPEYLTSAALPSVIEEGVTSPAVLRGECVALTAQRLILRVDTSGVERPPPKKGYLFVDLTGDSAALKRREHARLRILSNRTGVQVFSWLEGMPVSVRGRRRHEPLSPAARAHFGSAGPNQRQIEALRVALNTPDIALIQGPPGTGKTRTIAALLTRLSEIAEAEERESDKNLLTSFQHDAVENAAAISGVNGLPAIKIGRKRGSEDDSELVIKKWRQQRIDHLQDALAHRTERPKQVVLNDLRAKRVAYLAAPGSEAGAADLLGEILSKTGRLISPTLEQEVRTLIARLRRDASVDDNHANLIAAVRGVRTTEIAFQDDGPRSAFHLLHRLEGRPSCDASTKDLLSRAKDWESGQPLDFLPKLLALQEDMLNALAAPKPRTAVPQVNADVAAILERVIHEVEIHVAGTPDEGMDLVLERLLNDLTHAHQELRDTLGRYTVVLAATCQQSVGKKMLDHLQSDDDFATVIVDEAARANPLDLMIPLSRARRRIILVGDHRQLPHMLEPNIERELDKSLNEETRDAMKKSLFQRLFAQAKSQEARDGIKRYVTLNAQYRMHPVLGRFVSRVFYERHGSDESFDSPGDPAVYSHPLSGPLAGKKAAWKHLALRQHGGEERVGTSWQRRSEAQWIAEEVRRVLDAHPTLSVGVISFYSAQVRCILEAMLHVGLAERDETGSLAVAASYEHTTSDRGEPTERLRVGTVDAFQGKEFDLVFLSLTRANPTPSATPTGLRKKFGHLLLENRLCVAMSRQRRLLTVVGDLDMVSSSEASQAAPGLAEFLALCRTGEGVVF